MEDSGFVEWLQSSGIRIGLIILGAWLFGRFGKIFISRAIRTAIKPDSFASHREEKLREDTLISIVVTTLKVLIWVLALMIVLAELNLDIGPLVAGAGVAGIAIGFGAQELIQDFVSGVFIILENQYRVGDVVEFDGTSGRVEEITMRSTVLRDLDGNVHHFPNGMVRHTVNMTMEYSRINLDIGVSYEDDIDQVENVVNEVGKSLAKDKIWGKDIVEAPAFWRIDNFGDSSVDIKIVGKTEPSRQWAVAGEFRKRLKIAFEENGIEIPYPQRVLHEAKPKNKK